MSQLHLIRASAGTGKTECLSRLVLGALAPGLADPPSSQPPITMEGLIAVTYTTKAANELRSRLRQKLAMQARYNQAHQLGLAYVGTVHSVCKRLLDEFSISAGLPPSLDVLPETLSGHAIAEALEGALSNDEHRQLESIAVRLRPNMDRFGGYDWLRDARAILELARSNAIRPSQLPSMAERSFESYFPLVCLGRVMDDPAAQDAKLLHALNATLAALGDGDGTDVTNKAILELGRHRRTMARGNCLAWSDWHKLAGIKPAKVSDELLVALRNVAAEHCHHPRFRDDLRDYTSLVYRAAANGLACYTSWKQARRFLDFTDMEELTLELLENPVVRESLAGRLQLLVVDEFQDTSPIQLALFTRLAELSQRAVWVGDRKQSIYAFRGADPVLMDAVIAAHERGGNRSDTLGTSYRSRAALVEFASELFARGLARDGYRDEEVRVTAHRKTNEEGLLDLPPLGLWALEAKKQEDETAALAQGIRRLLAQPEQTPVKDRASGQVRPLCASDIAVLVGTNKEATGLANDLGRMGIPAIVPRAGLLGTPVGTLLHVALRLVVDPKDAAAHAIATALRGFDGQTPEEWLERVIAAHRLNRAKREAGQQSITPEELSPLLGLAQLSPVECVDALIAEFDMPQLATRWPEPETARANLEAFRTLAATYEEECRAERRGGSLVGFLRYLEGAATDGADLQHAGGTDAVEIATYHRAKGLEWPVVILWSLDAASRGFGPTPTTASQRLDGGGRSGHFQPTPESDAASFDSTAPLDGRWIRFFPWPYGATKTGGLVDAVAQTPSGQARIAAAASEALRLLYVGITRARDHLIFAIGAKPPTKKSGATTPTLSTAWLDSLHDGQNPLIVLPELPNGASSIDVIRIRGSVAQATPTRVWRLGPSAEAPDRLPQANSRRWFLQGTRIHRPSFYIAPSRAELDWPEVALGNWQVEVHDLGGRLPLTTSGADMADVGNTIHAFFAADPMDALTAERTAIAQRLLAARGMTSLTSAEELVAAHDRLRAFVARVLPSGTWLREVPVVGAIGTPAGRRQVRGSIDLLVDAPTQCLVIDHKSFPGSREQSIEHARSYAPQLAAYSHLLTKGRGVPPRLFIHMPVAGLAVGLVSTDGMG